MRLNCCFVLITFIALPICTSASDSILLDHGPLDKAILNTATIDRTVPMHVRNFDVSQAKLGKSKHEDIARQMAQSVPHLLASDIVNELRANLFTAVTLEQSNTSTDGGWVLEGQFTELNPGSQAARLWVGFGAGKSKVCVMATLKDDKGSVMGEFAHCSNGLGWGGSDSQLETDAERLGHKFAQFFSNWADGKYSH